MNETQAKSIIPHKLVAQGEVQDTGNGGRKNDSGKNMIALIPSSLLEELGKVLTHGMKKYEADNWKMFDPVNNKDDRLRLLSGLMRHYAKAKRGYVVDKDAAEQGDDLNHWAQIAFYAMVMIEKTYSLGLKAGEQAWQE